MSALKEQMASMMEAMLGMKQLMEKNAATAAAVSSAAEADTPDTIQIKFILIE